MSVYLVRHGHSLSKNEDPSQSLSETGRADTRRIAEVAAGYRVPVSAIHYSVKKRAGQTAAILAAILNPEGGVEERQGLQPMDNIISVAESLDPAGNVMLVGHLPFLSRLTGWLITGNSDNQVIVFQNSAIVCLDKINSRNWSIKWALMPHIS